MPRLGYNRSHCDRVSPSRICPLVIVRRGEIFVYIPVTSRLFPEVLPSCSHLGGNTPGGASMRRLLTVLRFLRSTLSSWSWWARRDFAVRVCVDEFCHGLFEDRPVPWLTMVSCACTPSLPAVQWSTLKGRDPNLSEWESVLAQHAALADVANASWPCRIRRAVWRGSASEPYTTNMRWTGNRTLERIPISIGKWRAQGRLALMWQHCMNPELLDVHVRGLQGPNPGVGRNLRSDVRYTRCVAKLGIHKQKVLSLAEQARMYRYLVSARLLSAAGPDSSDFILSPNRRRAAAPSPTDPRRHRSAGALALCPPRSCRAAVSPPTWPGGCSYSRPQWWWWVGGGGRGDDTVPARTAGKGRSLPYRFPVPSPTHPPAGRSGVRACR